MAPEITRGCLDLVELNPMGLRIAGWAAAPSSTIDALKIRIGRARQHVIESFERRASPDVQSFHPALKNVERCRFDLTISLDRAEREAARGSLVRCVPLTGGAEGCTLVGIIEPSIPLPRTKDSKLIGGAFLPVAYEFLGYFISLAALAPSDRVLDIGCGVGRIAYALAHYLDATGSYDGFDVVPRLIKWASTHIARRYPNFRFRTLDVHNKWYNPKGRLRAEGLRFPYDDEAFDFAVLTSVLTHMYADGVRNYLREITRVLKPGGRCFVTCFMVTREAENLIQSGKSAIPMRHRIGDIYTGNPDVPEDCIGFEEADLLRWIAERGLMLSSKYCGSWCGRTSTLTYQDVLLLEKR